MEIGGLIVGLIAGLVVGGLAVFLWRRDGAAASKELENTRSEMKSYRQEVTEHYVKTAELVDRLTQDYKSLFEHLNDGAMKQMNPEVLEQKLASRSAAPVVLGVLGREGLPAPQSAALELKSAEIDTTSPDTVSNTASDPAAALDPARVTEVAREQRQDSSENAGEQHALREDDSVAVDPGNGTDIDGEPGAVKESPQREEPASKGPGHTAEDSDSRHEQRK